MPSEFRFEGDQVATVYLRNSDGDSEELMVFRAPQSWTVLTITRTTRYGVDGSLERADGTVSCTELADVVALQEFCEGRDCWPDVLDAVLDEAPELYDAWVPHQVGIAEIAAQLRVEPSKVAKWYRWGQMPERSGIVDGGPAWGRQVIERWASQWLWRSGPRRSSQLPQWSRLGSRGKRIRRV